MSLILYLDLLACYIDELRLSLIEEVPTLLSLDTTIFFSRQSWIQSLIYRVIAHCICSLDMKLLLLWWFECGSLIAWRWKALEILRTMLVLTHYLIILVPRRQVILHVCDERLWLHLIELYLRRISDDIQSLVFQCFRSLIFDCMTFVFDWIMVFLILT